MLVLRNCCGLFVCLLLFLFDFHLYEFEQDFDFRWLKIVHFDTQTTNVTDPKVCMLSSILLPINKNDLQLSTFRLIHIIANNCALHSRKCKKKHRDFPLDTLLLTCLLLLTFLQYEKLLLKPKLILQYFYRKLHKYCAFVWYLGDFLDLVKTNRIIGLQQVTSACF